MKVKKCEVYKKSLLNLLLRQINIVINAIKLNGSLPYLETYNICFLFLDLDSFTELNYRFI